MSERAARLKRRVPNLRRRASRAPIRLAHQNRHQKPSAAGFAPRAVHVQQNSELRPRTG